MATLILMCSILLSLYILLNVSLKYLDFVYVRTVFVVVLRPVVPFVFLWVIVRSNEELKRCGVYFHIIYYGFQSEN